MEEEIVTDRRRITTAALLIGVCLIAYGIFLAGEYFGIKGAVEHDTQYIKDMCFCMNRTTYVPHYEIQTNLSFLDEILEKEK